MTAYQFHPETGHFTGPYTCQRDPVASRRLGRDVYLLPADATWNAPPAYNEETQNAVWTGDTWVVEDIPEPAPVPEPEPEPPTEQERTRADLDYVAAMLGIDL